MDRSRRLCLTFLAFGFILPLMPHALGFPHDRLYCLDIRVGDAERGFAGLFLLLTGALLRAYVASLVGDRWKGWLWAGSRSWRSMSS